MPPWLKPNTKQLFLVSSLLSVALLLVIALNTQRNMRQMSANNSELYNAYRISELMKLLKGNMNFLENKRKGYIITGDPRFLEEFSMKETETRTWLRSLEKYFSGKPQEDDFYRLKELVQRRFGQMKELRAGTQVAGFSNNQNAENEGNNIAELNVLIDKISETLSHDTKVLLENSIQYVHASEKWGFAEVVIGIVVSLIALIIVFRDINTRMRLELQLRKAKEKADENATIKERFMANMSHEIRTPLNAIVGFTDLLSKGQLSRKESDYVRAIQSSSTNLLNIVNDILDFSKLEAGKMRFEKISFSLRDVADNLRQMFASKAMEKNIGYVVEIDKAIPELLFGDPNRLSQILINLLGNAFKFTSGGQVRLACELKSLEKEYAQIVFIVQDSGIGIPADKLESVFHRFSQASGDTSRKYGGSGLGLAIVKELVELQHGSIQVKSRENEGTTFTVTLGFPVSYAEQQGRQSLTAQRRFAADQRVLLADDNEFNRELTKEYLNGFGLTIDTAADGPEALEKIRIGDYHLVLMDIQMPQMDGFECSLKARRDLHFKGSIVAMTANSLEGEREKCLSAGMNDYLSKPFTEKDLYAVLSRYLKLSDAALKNERNMTDKPGSVDISEFLKMTRGNRKFMREMIEMFLERNPLDLEGLSVAIEKADWKQLRELSHRMKTSVGFMGMKDLVEKLDRIERLSENKENLEEVSSLVGEVNNRCRAGQQSFKRELEKLNEG